MHRELDRRFAGLEDATRALILSAASGEPLLIVGPPGTAKSMLIKTFCELAGVDREGSASRYLSICSRRLPSRASSSASTIPASSPAKANSSASMPTR